MCTSRNPTSRSRDPQEQINAKSLILGSKRKSTHPNNPRELECTRNQRVYAQESSEAKHNSRGYAGHIVKHLPGPLVVPRLETIVQPVDFAAESEPLGQTVVHASAGSIR